MSARTPRHVTRIRGEFFASESLHRVVNEFFEEGEYPADVRLHTASQRIVPIKQYRLHAYGEAMRLAEKGLAKPLAQRALQLMRDPAPQLHAPPDRPLRIAFQVGPTAIVQEINDALEKIPTFEPTPPSRAIVLLELGRAGLKDPKGLAEARRHLMERLEDKSPTGRLTVGGVHLSTTDIRGYPIPVNVYWPS
jgi:hypothetical protein